MHVLLLVVRFTVFNADNYNLRGGGWFPALLSTGAVILLEVFSQVSLQQHNAYNRKGNVK